MGNRETLTDPDVSVILPVYNRANLVGRALQSVLDQTYADLEVIVVDDGSTDGLQAALARFNDRRLRIISLSVNSGAAVARNAGICQARGRYLAFIDSDDWWLPHKLDHQLAFMRRSKARISCTTSMVLNKYHPAGVVRGDGSESIAQKELTSGCVWSPGSTLATERELFEEVGSFDERLTRLEDWDWMLRTSKRSPIAIFGETLSFIDSRHTSTTSYEAVKSSARQMKEKYNSDFPFFSVSGLVFRAALERELAAAAYKHGSHALALKHFLKSVLHSPHLRWGTIKRLAFAVYRDLSQLLRSKR